MKEWGEARASHVGLPFVRNIRLEEQLDTENPKEGT